MSPRFTLALVAALLGAALVAAAAAIATPSSGLTSEILGRVTMEDRLSVNRSGIAVRTTKPVEVVTQRVTLARGGTTGWHHHPGINFVSVVQGALTSYDATCKPRTISAGSGFTHSTRDVHVARNEGSTAAIFFVTYVKPAPESRLPNAVDEQAPAGCAVR